MRATFMYVRIENVPEPAKVFDRTVGYRAMADRESIKGLVRP